MLKLREYSLELISYQFQQRRNNISRWLAYRVLVSKNFFRCCFVAFLLHSLLLVLCLLARSACHNFVCFAALLFCFLFFFVVQFVCSATLLGVYFVIKTILFGSLSVRRKLLRVDWNLAESSQNVCHSSSGCCCCSCSCCLCCDIVFNVGKIKWQLWSAINDDFLCYMLIQVKCVGFVLIGEWVGGLCPKYADMVVINLSAAPPPPKKK